jgi:hypothetical protein
MEHALPKPIKEEDLERSALPHSGYSGSELERVRLRDGSRLVPKHTLQRRLATEGNARRSPVRTRSSSSTVKHLIAVSGLSYADRRMSRLKGVPDPWCPRSMVDPRRLKIRPGEPVERKSAASRLLLTQGNGPVGSLLIDARASVLELSRRGTAPIDAQVEDVRA